MAATPSTMLPLGTPAPDFRLTDTVSGATVTRDGLLQGKQALLVMFICNHCPFVIHVRDQLVALGHDYAERPLAIAAISANDPATHPDDGPEKLAEAARKAGYRFPMLFDPTQEVAKAYTAACTPDFFLFDGAGRLVYRGQLDDSRPSNAVPVDGRDLRAAIEAVLAGRPVAAGQKPSLGCNIKWKKGNEPSYYGV